MKKLIQLALCIALLAANCLAADSAILRNGFSILHQRRQIIGTVTRLYLDGDQSSFVDIPTAEIDHFESVPDSPTPPPAPQPASTPHSFDLTQAVKDASGTYRLDPDRPRRDRSLRIRPRLSHSPPGSSPRLHSAFLRSNPSRKGRQRNLPARSRSCHQRHPRRKRIQYPRRLSQRRPGTHAAHASNRLPTRREECLRPASQPRSRHPLSPRTPRALQLRSHQSPRRLQRRTAARRAIQRSPALLRNQSLRSPHRPRLQQKETRRQIPHSGHRKKEFPTQARRSNPRPVNPRAVHGAKLNRPVAIRSCPSQLLTRVPTKSPRDT